jgi:NAD(P)-dependent dehydrogenase (short-subunit alcohol dehydrogenase family)
VTNRFSLDGRVALVTGGGTGIGRGSALVLAEYGADIALAGRRAEPLESTAAEIRALGRKAIAIPTDVTNPEECERLVALALHDLGRIDVLVNCAGGATTRPIAEWSDEEWDRVFALNLSSVWRLSRLVATSMLEQGSGSIVNISSGASLLAMPQAAPYGAAKAGVNNLTGAMAAAWTRRGVRTNAIAVGAVRAATLTEEAERHGIDPDIIGTMNGLGRLGEPDEIGYGVLFFASDASSFCSGQTLHMHGGPGSAGH